MLGGEKEVEGNTESDEEREAASSKSLVRRMVLLLGVTSVVASATSFFIDGMIQRWVPGVRLQAFHMLKGYMPELAVDTFISIILVWSARIIVKFVPACAGSGIPEVKCMLSGERLTGYLSFRVAAAKALGLGLASSAGLQIGKEGPFVHFATCISARLTTMPYFKDFRQKNTRETLLLAGVSVGVGTTFSAPISGVLWGLELMMPHMYTKFDFRSCCFGSIVGSLTFKMLQMLLLPGANGILPLLSSDVAAETASSLSAELLFIGLCVLLGVICGYLGGIFVQCQVLGFHTVKKIRSLEKFPSWLSKFHEAYVPLIVRDFGLLAILAAIISFLKVYGGSKTYGLTLPALCNDLLRVDYEESIWVLFKLLCDKWLLTVCSLCMPVPSGCVAPVLALGILIGRMYGLLIPEPVQTYLCGSTADASCWKSYQARFAIVGAACFAGAVCHAMAMVVTVFELLAIPRIVIPLTLATLASIRCATQVGPSIFDAIISAKGLPGLPTLNAINMAAISVVEAASLKGSSIRSFSLPRRSTLDDLKAVQINVDECSNVPKILPITEAIGDRLALLGAVDIRRLRRLTETFEDEHRRDPQCDLFTVAVQSNLLHECMLVEKHSSCLSVYLKCHAEHYDRTVMVMDKGTLVGILTISDLFRNINC